MGDACKALSKIYAVLGGIGAFYLSYSLGRTASIGHYSTSYERDWLLTIAIFLGSALSVAIVSVVLEAVGEIHDRVYYLSYSGRTALSSDAEQGLAVLGQEAEAKRIVANGGWKCPDCGKANNSYETTCICGKSKYF